MAEPLRTTDAGIIQRTNTYAAPISILKRAMAVITTDVTATPVPMPKNKGNTATFRRYNAFDAKTTPLVEGVTPTGSTVTTTNYVATLRQYGDFVRFTDQVVDLHEDNVPAEITSLNGENVGRTVEALNYGVIRAGTSVFYQNGTARSDVNTPVSLAKLRKVVTFLQQQKAAKIREIISPSPNYGTSSVEASYIAIGHTDLGPDLRNIVGFEPVANYGSRSVIHEQEFGKIEDIRFILSPDLPPWANAGGAAGGTMRSTSGTNADVYPLIIFGKNAWHTIALRGKDAVTVTSQMPGNASDTDPLGQRGFQGWKIYHAAKITNEAWMARLETSASAL